MLMLLLCKRNKLIKFKSKSTCRNKYQIGAGHIEIQLPQPYVVDSMKFVLLFYYYHFNVFIDSCIESGIGSYLKQKRLPLPLSCDLILPPCKMAFIIYTIMPPRNNLDLC